MQQDKARKAAEHILEDRRGADYYQDIQLLSDYLTGALDLADEDAKKTAQVIQEDRSGANYYANVDILADFLRR